MLLAVRSMLPSSVCRFAFIRNPLPPWPAAAHTLRALRVLLRRSVMADVGLIAALYPIQQQVRCGVEFIALQGPARIVSYE